MNADSSYSDLLASAMKEVAIISSRKKVMIKAMGVALRSCRHRRGVSHVDIFCHTKIPVRRLNDIMKGRGDTTIGELLLLIHFLGFDNIIREYIRICEEKKLFFPDDIFHIM